MDLFACETAAGLSMAAYLLREELDGISPFICERIRYEIKQRILVPYLNRDFFWKGKPGQKVNNWTAWCTQNLSLIHILLEGECDFCYTETERVSEGGSRYGEGAKA